MKKTIPLLAAAIATAGISEAVLIAGFDFQTTATGGTAIIASAAGTPSPLIYTANFGAATLYLDGSNGSSAFTTGVNNPQVTAFAGSTVNTDGTDFSTVTSGAASLAIANASANGNRMVFVLSMTDREGLSISYSTQSTATGFNAQEWSYSVDGITFVPFDTFGPGGAGAGEGGANLATTFAAIGTVNLDTSALSVLDDLDTVYIGLTFNGASAAAGNNRLDNIQFNVVPEPTAAALGALGLLALLRRRRA